MRPNFICCFPLKSGFQRQDETIDLEKQDGKENQVNRKLVGKENQVNGKLVGKENQVNGKLVDKEKPVNENLVVKEKPVDEKLVGEEKPVNEKLVGKEGNSTDSTNQNRVEVEKRMKWRRLRNLMKKNGEEPDNQVEKILKEMKLSGKGKVDEAINVGKTVEAKAEQALNTDMSQESKEALRQVKQQILVNEEKVKKKNDENYKQAVVKNLYWERIKEVSASFGNHMVGSVGASVLIYHSFFNWHDKLSPVTGHWLGVLYSGLISMISVFLIIHIIALYLWWIVRMAMKSLMTELVTEFESYGYIKGKIAGAEKAGIGSDDSTVAGKEEQTLDAAGDEN